MRRTDPTQIQLLRCLMFQRVKEKRRGGGWDYQNTFACHISVPAPLPSKWLNKTAAATWVTLASHKGQAKLKQSSRWFWHTLLPPIRSPWLRATSPGFSALFLIWSEAAHTTPISPWKCHLEEVLQCLPMAFRDTVWATVSWKALLNCKLGMKPPSNSWPDVTQIKIFFASFRTDYGGRIEFSHLTDKDGCSADHAVSFPFFIIFQEALFNPANIEF